MDIRIQRTKIKLNSTLAQLLKEKKINDITVLELCKTANINRTTFYKYYADVNDLVQKIEEDIINDIVQDINDINRNYLLTFTSKILERVNKENSIIRQLISDNGDHNFLKQILSKVKKESIEEWQKLLKKADSNDLNNIYNFIIDGSIGIINNWVNNKCKEDPKNISLFINKICMSGLSSFI